MRSALFALLAASALPLSFAQVPSIVEGSAFETHPEQWHRVIRNQSPSSVVAFYERWRCPQGVLGPRGVTHDAMLYSGNHEIHPGESIEIEAGAPSRCFGNVNAAIFSDGHAEGEPKGLDDLYSARRGAYKALGESIELLNSIRDQHESLQHVIDALNSKYQASLRERTESAGGHNLVCYVILQTLRDSREHPHLPSDTKIENEAEIENMMSANGVSYDEARAILFGKRLEEWKSLLENNLRPPQ